jgi:tetratricopeptide (TPR) repeat protein
MANLKSPQQQDVLAEIDVKVGNARAAWDWAVKHALIPQLFQAIDGLCHYYQWRGRLEEGQTACQSAIDELQDAARAGEIMSSSPPAHLDALPDAGERRYLLAKALIWQSVFTRLTGYTGLAGPILEKSIVLLDALESIGRDVRAERAFALLEMGRQAFDLDRTQAQRCFEQSLDLYRALDDRWGMADTLHMLGWLADGLGHYDRARQTLNESLSIRQVLGDRRGTANALSLLGLAELRVGELDQGESLLRRSVMLLHDTNERIGLTDGLHFLGYAAFLQGKFEHGIALQEECLELANDLALGHQRGMALQALGTYHAMLGQYEQAREYARIGLAHARLLSDAYVIGATCSVLGLTSLVQEDYAETHKWLTQSLVAYREIGQRDAQSWSLTYLGYAALGPGDLAQARQHFYDALQIGVETRAFLPITLALAGIALMMARLDDPKGAVELWALLSRYPLIANAPLFQDTVGRHIATAAADLPSATIATAKKQGLAGDVQSAISAALTMLNSHNPTNTVATGSR